MTTVETALVLTVFCMLLFGVFEYTRFLFVLHVTNNATRDGARYAAVNMSMPSNFYNTNYQDASGNVYTNITSYTTALLGGADKQLSSYAVSVYAVDPVGLAQTPPVIQVDPNATSWNNTSFPNLIAVTITGTYTPIAPSLLFMPSSIPLTVTGTASCES
jgi:Flp pilus assembly protein TadG